MYVIKTYVTKNYTFIFRFFPMCQLFKDTQWAGICYSARVISAVRMNRNTVL